MVKYFWLLLIALLVQMNGTFAQDDLSSLENSLQDAGETTESSTEAQADDEATTETESTSESEASLENQLTDSDSTVSASPREPAPTPSLRMPEEDKSIGMIDRQKDKVKADAKAINLRSVLEEGLRRNAFENIRKHFRAKFELEFENDYETFWYPNVSLYLNSEPQLVNQMVPDNTSTQTNNPTPVGTFGLSLGDYTVFNWGKDYLEFQNQKYTFERNKQRLNEQRRKLRFGLISQYFNVVRVKNILRVRREQLRQASFAHRMAKEKLNLGKIKVQEFYQTKTEFLRAQTDYQESLFMVTAEEESLANLLGDDPQTSYSPEEQLNFKNLTTDEEDSLKAALSRSPAFLDARLQLENSARTYQRVQKENLPLPKFSMNLGAYTYDYSNIGATNNYNTNVNGNRSIDLVATINMKWAIFGDGGIFNSRTNQMSYIDKRISEIGFFNTKRELEVHVTNLYKLIRFLENKIQFAQFQSTNAQKTLDTSMDNYLAGRATFADIKLAIDGYVESQLTYENSKFTHLVKKLELSDNMGMEDFPGDNFEQLAVK